MKIRLMLAFIYRHDSFAWLTCIFGDTEKRQKKGPTFRVGLEHPFWPEFSIVYF